MRIMVRSNGEQVTITLKGGRKELLITGQSSRFRKSTTDRMVMIDWLHHFKSSSVTTDGDINEMIETIKGKPTDMKSLEDELSLFED
jgi:ribulose-5-phosphate 4-epimerase/fuculose-1-phosphate aldolase